MGINQEILITIKHAWAQVRGPVELIESTLDQTLRYESKDVKKTQAYKQKRVDGFVPMYEDDKHGFKFPAGLLVQYTDFLRAQRIPHKVQDATPKIADMVDPAAFDKRVMKGIDLFPWQYDGCMAMIKHQRGGLSMTTDSGKTFMSALAARFFYDQANLRTLLITSRMKLTYDTQATFVKCMPHIKVGLFVDGHRRMGPVVVGCVDSLRDTSSRDIRTLLDYECLMVDECHHLAAEGWFNFVMQSRALLRIGMSGTIKIGDAYGNARITGATGPVCYTVSAQQMTAVGKSSKVKVVMVCAKEASTPDLVVRVNSRPDWKTNRIVQKKQYPNWKISNEKAIIRSEEHNRALVESAAWFVREGRRTLIVVRRMEQIDLICKFLSRKGLKHAVVKGEHDVNRRRATIKAFFDRKIQVLVASTVLDEGENVYGINAMVLGESVKSIVPVIQRPGRSKRKDLEDVWIADHVSQAAPIFQHHGDVRAQHYDTEGFQVLILEEWKPGHAHMLPFKRWKEYYGD